MKNKYKKKVLCILLALALVFTLTPAIPGAVENAYAAEPDINITDSAADSSGTGWSYVSSTKTLTLNGYNGSYIYANGMNTLNLALEGANTIAGNSSSGTGDYCGICCDGVDLNISGTGSLTINANSNSDSRPTYGIYAGDVTMSGGTVEINAGADTSQVYGVYAKETKLEITGGKLTVNVIGQGDGYGVFANAGKLTVGSGAEVDVTVTNNGSNQMYGVYNSADSVGGGIGNGDIELAGKVNVTRDSGSTGTGTVYGIANNSTSTNTDGVISITGGTVTVTNADKGIAALTKGHADAFADVDISGGEVNVTSELEGSNGIVSWNNGVTISGGTVTASTVNSALWLADSDISKKTGLVNIKDDAKVSLTSAGYKTLMVQKDDSTSSTRVHQINLTSGGSVTVKSTTDDYYAFPVQGYFNLGSSTKITEGSFRATEDGINAGDGKLFVADNTTKRVVVEYNAPAPNANAVSVNGHDFGSPSKLYYKNGDSDTGNNSSDYNAHYDPNTGILELKNYDGGRIIIGGSDERDITIKLVGDNTITYTGQYAIVNSNGGDITITSDSDATLTMNVTNDIDYAYGIACDIPGSYSSRSREITIGGKANVTVNATSNSMDFNDAARGISTPGTVTIQDDASFTANCKSSTSSTGLQSAAGICGASGVTINTTGKVDIDVSQCSGEYNYGIYGSAANSLTKVGEMTIKWKQSSGSGAHVYTVGSFDSAAATHAINVDTTNCVATYRYGTPYTVTVNNGSCDAANGQYLKDDTVTVTADTISDLTFKKWSSADVTVDNETNDTTSFIMPGKNVTVTANYNLFTTAPSFARTSDTQGTISFTLAKTPDSAPNLVGKDSDTVVGNQYFYGANLERSNTVTNAGTYAVPNGDYRIAVQYGGVLFYSDVFTVDYTAVTGPSAAVSDVTVSGTTGEAIVNKEVSVTLSNDTFASTLSDSWITNLPAGLTQSVARTGETTATITISGTPTAASTAKIAITIPNGNLVTSTTDLTVTANDNAKYNITVPTYAVNITAGTGMSTTGSASQNVEQGTAITSVVYTAAAGYYFPTDYSVAAVNGINVTRNGYTQITVSGTPTAAVNMTLNAATPKTKETTPAANFAANDINSGILSDVGNGMKYSLDGGSSWYAITGINVNISSGVSAENDIKVYKPASDSNTKLDSDIQTIDITKAAKPTGVTGNNCTTEGNNDGKLQNVNNTIEYKKSDASGWTAVSDTVVSGLTNGTYYVRIKASGTVLASDNQTVEIAEYGVPVLTGTVNISGTEKFGEMLTASVSGDNSGSKKFTYTWKCGSTEIGSGNTYTLKAEDIGQTVKCEVKADDCTGTISKTTGTIAKADGPAAPVGLTGVAPTTSGGADGKIQNTDATMEWSKTTDFATKTDCSATETTVGVAGTYYVRVKETTTHNAGAYATVTVPAYSAPVIPGGGGGYIPPAQTPTIDAGEGVKVTLNADGTVATITVEAGYDLADVVLNGTSQGKVTEVKGLKTGDKLVVTATKKAAEPTKEDILAALADQKLVARSKVTTSPNGKKAILITWYDKNGNEVTFDGVQIFRSTKRNSGYGTKPIFTSTTGKYYNTSITEGTRYYYKVRGFVVIDGQKYYTDWSLKAIRTAK